MTSSKELGLVGAWFLFGQARIVLTYKLAEHRIDDSAPALARAVSRAASAARRDTANYDAPGRRLLPWYVAVNRAYWTLVAAGCAWSALSR